MGVVAVAAGDVAGDVAGNVAGNVAIARGGACPHGLCGQSPSGQLLHYYDFCQNATHAVF